VLLGPDTRAIDVVQIPGALAARLGWLLDGVKHALPEAGPLNLFGGRGQDWLYRYKIEWND
jgi:hypothetical protein